MTSITTTRPTPTVATVAGDRVWPLAAALLAAFARTVVRLAGGLAVLAERGQLGPDADVTASRRSGARV